MKSVEMIVRVCELWLLRRWDLSTIYILFFNKGDPLGRLLLWTKGWRLVPRHTSSLELFGTAFMVIVLRSSPFLLIICWGIKCVIGHKL